METTIDSHHSKWVFSTSKASSKVSRGKLEAYAWRREVGPGCFVADPTAAAQEKATTTRECFIKTVRFMYSNHLARKKTQKKTLPIRRRLFFHFPGSGSETSQVTFRLAWPVWAPATPTHPKVDQKPKASAAWSRWKLRPVSSAKRSASGLTQPTCTGTFKSRPQHHS